MKKKRLNAMVSLCLALLLLLGATGCTRETAPETAETPLPQETPAIPAQDAPVSEADAESTPPQVELVEIEPHVSYAPAETAAPTFCVVIDPGHQSAGNPAQEPIGPGASETKAKVTGGTYGANTKLYEYELNLLVSLRLRDELERRGYQVVMTRETHDVDLSNIERTAIANEAQADAYVRIHANGSDDPSAHGVLMLNMTADSPYNAALYPQSRALSDAILEAVIETTGAKNCGVMETNTMSGINWSQVPVTILEMGYMTNPDEEQLLATAEYQEKIAQGVADGLDAYFRRQTQEDGGELPQLAETVQAELDRLDSRWDVWIEDLDSGDYAHCTRNLEDGDAMVSASLIKLFIMGAVYDQIEAGVLSEDDVWDRLYYMITISDNESANSLTRLLGGGDAAAGMEAVNAWAASIGCTDVRHQRLMLQNNGLENYVTAEACANMLRLLYTESCVSPYASQRMLQLLRDQQVNDRIPVGLPDTATAAHKTGNLSGLCVADVGIVFSPDGDYLLCAICNNAVSDQAATEEIVKITELASEYFHQAAS